MIQQTNLRKIMLFANFDLLDSVVYVMLTISSFLFPMMSLVLTHVLGTQFLNVWFGVRLGHLSLVLLKSKCHLITTISNLIFGNIVSEYVYLIVELIGHMIWQWPPL